MALRTDHYNAQDIISLCYDRRVISWHETDSTISIEQIVQKFCTLANVPGSIDISCGMKLGRMERLDDVSDAGN